MKQTLLLCLLVVCTLLYTPIISQANEWYEHVAMEQSDPYSIAKFGAGKVTGTFKMGGTNPARGLVYVILPSQRFRAILDSGAEGYEYFSNILSDSEAAYWKGYFARRSSYGIPWYIGVASSANLAVGLSMIALDQAIKMGQPEVSASAMSQIISKGGEFKHILTINPNNNKPLLISRAYYQVQVGDEFRSYFLYADQYAIKVE